MHGLVFTQLHKHIQTTYGDAVWSQALSNAGISNKTYSTDTIYPDTEILAIVDATAKATGARRDEILENTGKAVFQVMFNKLAPKIQADWKTIQVLEKLDADLLKSLLDNTVKPVDDEIISLKLVNDSKLTMKYCADRILSYFVLGLIKEIATHFGELDKMEISFTAFAKEQQTKITVKYL